MTSDYANAGASRRLVIAPLVNFFADDFESLDVTGTATIRLQTQRERDCFFEWFKPLNLVTLGLFDSRFCLARVMAPHESAPLTAEREFHDIVSALRLCKSGSVSFNVVATWLGGTADEIEPTFSWSLHQIVALNQPYTMTRDDAAKISRLVGQLKSIEEDQRLMRAISRFNDTYQKLRAEDRLVDYWIALESLFLSDTMELAFKAALRIARYISRSKKEGIKTFSFLKKSYSIRSKIVHGQGLPTDILEVSEKTGDILRRILTLALNAGGPPSLDNLDEDAASAGLSSLREAG